MSKAIKIGSLKFKGGVASSSCISTIAGILAKERNKKCLILDLDAQNTMKTLMGAKHAEKELSMAGILTADYDATKCIIKISENIDLIHSGGKAVEAFNRKNSSSLETNMKLTRAMEELEDQYDYILTDLSPTMSMIHQTSIIYNDYLILPSDMDLLSLSATRSTIHFVENLENTLGKQGIHTAKILGVIPMRYDSRRVVDNQILQDLDSLYENDLLHGGKVFNTIRESSNMKGCQARRKLLIEVFGKGKLADDYRKLTDNIIKEIEIREAQENILPKTKNEIVNELQ
jgi:chromosome partitioning protein